MILGDCRSTKVASPAHVSWRPTSCELTAGDLTGFPSSSCCRSAGSDRVRASSTHHGTEVRADAAVLQAPVGTDDGQQVRAQRLLDEREPDRLLLGAPRRLLLLRQVGHEAGCTYLPGSAALLFLGAGLGVGTFLLNVALLLDWCHGEKV